MSRLLAVSVVTGLACTIFVFAEAMGAKKASVPPEVAHAGENFKAAVNARDFAKVASLYAEDAVLMPPNGETISGRSEIEAYWRKLLEQEFTVASTASIDASVSGSLGYETGTYEISLKLPGGQSISDKGKYMNVMKRASDGHWYLAYDIWNSSLPMPSASK
jgi:uncharacterized protein (TIGR02246 family)